MVFKHPSREIQSVKTAFELIQVLQDLGGAEPSQLLSEMDLSKSSVHNYLSTLESMGYVVNENGTYRLGLRFLTHGIAARQSIRTRRIVLSELSNVAAKQDLPTWWVVEEFGRGIFLDVRGTKTRRPIYGRIGKRSYLHTHALGKAILATASRSYVREVIEYHGLPALTDEKTIEPDTLFDELEEIRDRGFAVSEDGAALGIRSIGVGFEDNYGGIHALGVFAESRELTKTSTQTIGEALVDAADSIGSEFPEVSR